MIIGIDARPLAQNNLSGTSEYTLRVLHALLELDKKNQYKLFFNSFSSVNFPNFPSDNIKVISSRIPNKFFNLPLQKILKYPKIDKKLQADVFWQPNIGFLALSAHVKKVLTIHDLSFLLYPEFFSQKMRFWHSLVDVKKQIMAADQIIAVSQNTKNDLQDLFAVDGGKIEVIHSGVSEDMSRKSGSELERIAKKYQLPKNFFLSLSTLEPRKNIDGILKAFDDYVLQTGDKSHHLVIAGGKGWKFDGVWHEYDKMQNQDLVRFIGYVNEKEKSCLYSLARAFIYVSYYEGFGFPPLEALACACPVILSTNSSLPEICGDQAMLIKANKSNELSSAMAMQSQNHKSLEQRLEIAKKIKVQYAWQESAKKHLELFRKIEQQANSH